ncbi:uncharacterized protein K489DRAFT_35864 [Dissoconium aciculare CBS 342.82]|uniref:Uncharacterized protein n=1 Tax=Dissoconium aciculare CBS 342.82 TaxID=1314786 RepID=A0A6J3M0W0_9PEZI|nr:uncharacterized protein K489DRAFT_35864 [Dissoconium aciculare CBS 342.82]KAF1820547.1 hypothetical protein K489DRAFT_35864 [Dissoconium aciculare CBS 342.82]
MCMCMRSEDKEPKRTCGEGPKTGATDRGSLACLAGRPSPGCQVVARIRMDDFAARQLVLQNRGRHQPSGMPTRPGSRADPGVFLDTTALWPSRSSPYVHVNPAKYRALHSKSSPWRAMNMSECVK